MRFLLRLSLQKNAIQRFGLHKGFDFGSGDCDCGAEGLSSAAQRANRLRVVSVFVVNAPINQMRSQVTLLVVLLARPSVEWPLLGFRCDGASGFIKMQIERAPEW